MILCGVGHQHDDCVGLAILVGPCKHVVPEQGMMQHHSHAVRCSSTCGHIVCVLCSFVWRFLDILGGMCNESADRRTCEGWLVIGSGDHWNVPQ